MAKSLLAATLSLLAINDCVLATDREGLDFKNLSVVVRDIDGITDVMVISGGNLWGYPINANGLRPFLEMRSYSGGPSDICRKQELAGTGGNALRCGTSNVLAVGEKDGKPIKFESISVGCRFNQRGATEMLVYVGQVDSLDRITEPPAPDHPIPTDDVWTGRARLTGGGWHPVTEASIEEGGAMPPGGKYLIIGFRQGDALLIDSVSVKGSRQE